MTLEDTPELGCSKFRSAYDVIEFITPHDKTKRQEIFQTAEKEMPSTVAIGEIRGDEALCFMSMTSKHKGVMATIHAETIEQGLSRLATYVQMCSQDPAKRNSSNKQLVEDLAKNIDLVVVMKRTADGVPSIVDIG